jgi:hypothetical protein
MGSRLYTWRYMEIAMDSKEEISRDSKEPGYRLPVHATSRRSTTGRSVGSISALPYQN